MPEMQKTIGLLGARSLIGSHLIALLEAEHFTIHAITRRASPPASGVLWHSITPTASLPHCALWVSMMPLWELPAYFSRLEQSGITRLIAFSSTSRIAKADSDDPGERQLAERLAEAENAVEAWATARGMEWTILRPTLIYDEGKDKNISVMASFIRRFGFFPVLGKGNGLRMPVYAGDLASAVLRCINLPSLPRHYYTLSGGETLTYREMVTRLFFALHKTPRILSLPESLFTFLIRCASMLPVFRHLTPGMAQRMSKDQAFPCDEAREDFAYNPRDFYPFFV